ncbi:hypothetical protein Tco_0238472 [Tanacetum coccineum]
MRLKCWSMASLTGWFLGRKNSYINKHNESSDRKAVRSQMRILSVISVKVFEKYGYNYLREIILRRADYQEYKISEKDFKNLHPNDFEDLFSTQHLRKLNHSQTDKKSLHMQLYLFEYNKGHGDRNCSEDDKRRSKDFTLLQSRKDYRSEGSIESLESSLLEEGIRDIDYRIINRTTRTVQKTDHASYLIGVIRLVRLEDPSETMVFHNEDGNPARANVKQALGYLKDGDGAENSQLSNISE